MEIIEDKKCSKCGRILPISMFSKNRRFADGLNLQCRECVSEYQKELRERRKSTGGKCSSLKKVYTNPALAGFTPRQLMEELKARGYSGKLQYTQEIII